METSQLILYSVPIFLLLMAVEWLYGMVRGRNTYRLNDTFCSLTLGLISRFPPAFKLGFSGVVYAGAADVLGIAPLSADVWTTWLVAFLLYDFSYYWKHRLCHERTLLWASHVVHHQSEYYNLSTALRQTSTSFLLSWVFYIPMFAIGVPTGVFIAVAAINLLYQFWVHTEHIGSLGVLDRILVTPSNHRVHHARNAEYIDANYGGIFILWDRIFGTYRAEMVDLPPVYGTRSPLCSWNPLWANLEVYAQMLRDTWQAPKTADKWRVWTSRTGWRPAAVLARSGSWQVLDGSYEKYATDVPRSYQAFAAVQFFMLALMTLWALLDVYQLSALHRAGLSTLVLLSAAITGGILQGRGLAIGLELGRSTALLVAAFMLPQWHFDPVLMQILCIHAVFNVGVIVFAWAHQLVAARRSISQP